MSAVTEVESTCLQVDHTDKHRDKHTVFVIRRERVVQSVGNNLRRTALLGHRAEQIDHH